MNLQFWRKDVNLCFGGKRDFVILARKHDFTNLGDFVLRFCRKTLLCAFGEKHDFAVLAEKHNFMVLVEKLGMSK